MESREELAASYKDCPDISGIWGLRGDHSNDTAGNEFLLSPSQTGPYIHIMCPKGSHVIGPSVVTCFKDGTWNDVTKPTCSFSSLVPLPESGVLLTAVFAGSAVLLLLALSVIVAHVIYHRKRSPGSVSSSVERLFRLSEDPPFYEDNPMFSHQLGEPCSRFAWTTWDSYGECEEEYVRFLDCGRDNRSLHDCASPDYNISFTRNSQYIGTGLCDILPHESLLYNQLSFPNDDVQPTILSAHAHGYPVTDHVIAHLLMYPRSYIQHWRDVEEM